VFIVIHNSEKLSRQLILCQSERSRSVLLGEMGRWREEVYPQTARACEQQPVLIYYKFLCHNYRTVLSSLMRSFLLVEASYHYRWFCNYSSTMYLETTDVTGFII